MVTRLRIVLGFGVLASAVAWASWSSGNLWYFVDLPSVLWVGTIILGGWLVSHGPVGVFRAFVCVWSADASTSVELYAGAKVFERGYQLAWGAGMTGLMVNLIVMLRDMSDPSKIGPAIAAALLAPLYGVLIAELVMASFHGCLVSGMTQAKHVVSEQPGPIGGVGHSMVSLGYALVFAVSLLALVAVLQNSHISSDEARAVVQQIHDAFPSH